MEMIENWKNNEQSEQNNSKAAVDFTSGKTMAHKVCCASLFEIFSSLPITPVSPHHLFISLVGLQEMLPLLRKNITPLKTWLNLPLNCLFLTYWILLTFTILIIQLHVGAIPVFSR